MASEMVVTLEELLEISLAGRTLSPGDILKLTAGPAPYFRAMSNTALLWRREGIRGGNFAPRLSGSRTNYVTQLFLIWGTLFRFSISSPKCFEVPQLKSPLTFDKM